MSRTAVALLALLAACRESDTPRAHEPLPAAATLPGATVAVGASGPGTPATGGEGLVRTLGCGGCHAGLPAPARSGAPSLGGPGAPDAAVVYAALRRPPAAPVPGVARMPDYRFDEREALALALYLTGGDRETRAGGMVTAEDGARIFLAQNCAACHAHPSAAAWRNAPDLSGEGARVRPEWLAAYLRRPTPVRPFGFFPGTGSRMPDFRLTRAEADSVQAYLSRDAVAPAPFAATTLSAFAMHKAATLVRERYPCMGCHAVGGEGGRVGPDLARARTRLQPAFVRAMILDPGHTAAGSMMPRTPMPAERVDLLASYLLQLDGGADARPPLSLVDTPTHFPSTSRAPAALYGRYCAQCHGTAGRGDGYNAPYLPTPPAAHANAGYMALRSDDTEFDGIHAGGAVLNRSVRMPAFGETLTRDEIAGLVRHLRQLCRCEGPRWGRTGRG